MFSKFDLSHARASDFKKSQLKNILPALEAAKKKRLARKEKITFGIASALFILLYLFGQLIN